MEDREWDFKTPQFHFMYSLDTQPVPEDFYMHAHERFELFHFLSGNAKYLVEGTEYTLMPHDTLLLRPFEVHRLVLLDDSEPYERVVIHFSEDMFSEELRTALLRPFRERELGRGNRYEATDFGGEGWPFHGDMNALIERLGDDAEIFITAKIQSFLAETLVPFRERTGNETPFSAKITDVLEYINAHLCEDITVARICEECFLSRAQLNRLFKYATGTSVWQYITTKRLLQAKMLIRAGGRPTDVYDRCGFNEYSSFYRAYKAKFGNAPEQDKAKSVRTLKGDPFP